MKMNEQLLYHIDGSDKDLVGRLLDLPHKILENHESNDLAHMVLHEIGHDGSFGFNKVGYLVDNPDFNCLKGIAGYHKNDCYLHPEDIWESPELFAESMKNAKFSKNLSGFFDKSLCRQRADYIDQDALKKLGSQLDIGNPQFLTWRMKHGNHGILLFEEGSANQAHHRDLLQHVVAILGLC